MGKFELFDGTNWIQFSNGTVKSIGITVGEGLSVSNSPITDSGNIQLDLNDSGVVGGIYNYPTSLTVNSQGRLTSITEGVNPPITSLALTGAVIGSGSGTIDTILNSSQTVIDNIFTLSFPTTSNAQKLRMKPGFDGNNILIFEYAIAISDPQWFSESFIHYSNTNYTWRFTYNDNISNTQQFLQFESINNLRRVRFYTNLDLNNKNITSVAEPINSTDVVNRNYSDTRGHVAGDVKYSIQTTDHGKWLLWTNGRVLSRTTYADLYAVVVASGLIGAGVFGNGDGSTTFTMGDIAGRYIGTAGQGAGLTNRTLGAKSGSETISSVPSHTHTINHSHTGSMTSDNHNHTFNHTHSIAHDHGSFTSASDSHSHTYSGVTSGKNIVVFEDAGTAGGYTDYAGSGGADPYRILTSKLSSGTITDTHSHTINVPGYAGNSGIQNATLTSSDDHTHTLTVDTHSGSSGSTGISSVNVMNPGLFLNLFIFTGI